MAKAVKGSVEGGGPDGRREMDHRDGGPGLREM